MFREFVCNFIRHYMNATVKCDSDGDGLAETDASDEGLESVIVPIIFGIIFGFAFWFFFCGFSFRNDFYNST